MPTQEEVAEMERFRDRCIGLVVRLYGIVSPEAANRAHQPQVAGVD